MAVGIKEVATEAGVSIATVSRALRGLHHVNPETRKKILDAAKWHAWSLIRFVAFAGSFQ